MNKRIVFIALSILIPFLNFCQNLPGSRLADWSSAGVSFDSFPASQHIAITAFGADPSGSVACDSAFAAALSSVDGMTAVIYFPKGDFLFKNNLTVPSNILLVGAGSTHTTLLLAGEEYEAGIRFTGKATDIKTTITAPVSKGQSHIEVSQPDDFLTGEMVYISCNDSSFVTSGWALGNVGQLQKIIDKNSDTLFLESAFRHAIPLHLTPEATLIRPVQNSGIHGMKIIQKNPSDEKAGNISVRHAYDISIKEIESENCNFSHIAVSKSAKVSVRCSYFHDAHNYGGGGKAYGVTLQEAASDCLIENNVFNHLRHSVLLQSGANGNVIAYNFSTHPYWSGTALPADAAGDMVLHGNYPFCNLFEGNVCQNIVIDDSHGINGPDNTFFRNRAMNYGIFMGFNPASDQQIFIGNIILNTPNRPQNGLFALQGNGHHNQYNYYNGQIIPLDSEAITASSLFRQHSPHYFVNHPFPPIAMHQPDFVEIPAYQRFFKDVPVGCDGDSVIVQTTAIHHVTPQQVNIFPNPVFTIMQIDINAEARFKIVNIQNSVVQKGQLHTGVNEIVVHHLPAGVYFIQTQSGESVPVIKKFIKI